MTKQGGAGTNVYQKQLDELKAIHRDAEALLKHGPKRKAESRYTFKLEIRTRAIALDGAADVFGSGSALEAQQFLRAILAQADKPHSQLKVRLTRRTNGPEVKR
jgi:hypothetical protein